MVWIVQGIWICNTNTQWLGKDSKSLTHMRWDLKIMELFPKTSFTDLMWTLDSDSPGRGAVLSFPPTGANFSRSQQWKPSMPLCSLLTQVTADYPPAKSALLPSAGCTTPEAEAHGQLWPFTAGPSWPQAPHKVMRNLLPSCCFTFLFWRNFRLTEKL